LHRILRKSAEDSERWRPDGLPEKEPTTHIHPFHGCATTLEIAKRSQLSRLALNDFRSFEFSFFWQ
jgi:hypothetical protein